MKIFSADQIKKWDIVSTAEQNISSLDLMERAAHSCYEWLLIHNFTGQPLSIFCGKGNNGGDGLALARILLENNINVSVYIPDLESQGTDDFQQNLQRLQSTGKEIHFLRSELLFPRIQENEVVIDALFGTGLNKPLDGLIMQLVHYLNKYAANIISIDMPSGLFADKSTKGMISINATHTLSFQNYKLSFLFPENDVSVGELHIIDIGLSTNYHDKEAAAYELVDEIIIKPLIKQRKRFSHKGNYGHAALIAGSYGMMGAAILAARACLASGAGKLTCYIPSCGYEIMQSSVPEAMCRVSGEKYIENVAGEDTYNARGIGPGLGNKKETVRLLEYILENKQKELVLDADALNIISGHARLLQKVPAGSIITPHPKEFERLFGATDNEFERLSLAKEKAATLNIYIVLKGHFTAIITPGGKTYFNNTGNAGMAKAGMGDVLTGIITGLLAQQYSLPEAALLGVWIHGLAGDIAAEKLSMEAMQAGDLINCLPDAWKLLQT